MATREQVYEKYGVTAEAAQLFETELGTLLLGIQGMDKGWYAVPDPDAGRKLLDQIERRHTLGRLLGRLKDSVGIDDHIERQFDSALAARNRLFHGFYEKHNFKIDDDEGRDVMIDDLEQLHTELFQAWQIASAMTKTLFDLVLRMQAEALSKH